MLISPVAPPDWSSKDAEFFESFLNSSTGVKVLGVLAFHCPDLLDGSDLNKTLVGSGVAKGYQAAVELFFSLTKAQPQQLRSTESSYPSLDDDRQWDDVPINLA